MERLAKGEFIPELIADAHPSFPLANEPYCTRSQRIAYRDPASGRHMAEVHQYLHTDGTLGGWGKPDPKMIREGDVLLTLDKGQSDW